MKNECLMSTMCLGFASAVSSRGSITASSTVDWRLAHAVAGRGGMTFCLKCYVILTSVFSGGRNMHRRMKMQRRRLGSIAILSVCGETLRAPI